MNGQSGGAAGVDEEPRFTRPAIGTLLAVQPSRSGFDIVTGGATSGEIGRGCIGIEGIDHTSGSISKRDPMQVWIIGIGAFPCRFLSFDAAAQQRHQQQQ